MSEHFSLDNPKQRMREIMDRLSDQYGLAYIKCAVIKREDGEQCLYLADVKIQHRDDYPIKEKVQRYDNVTLAVVSLTLDELKTLLEDLDSGKINLKSLGRISAKNVFELIHCQISSRTHYAGYRDDWPSHGFRASLSKEEGPFKDLYRPLIKPGLPAYPNFFEACNVFFQHEQPPNHHEPIVINFLIPDYSARINVLEIAENQIWVSVERRELPLTDLAVQIFCTRPNGKHQNSEDLKLHACRVDGTEKVKFSADFVPDRVFTYLIAMPRRRAAPVTLIPSLFKSCSDQCKKSDRFKVFWFFPHLQDRRHSRENVRRKIERHVGLWRMSECRIQTEF